jgi:hypothetical protein
MTKTNVIFKFTQRALWLYIIEASIVLLIVMLMSVYR